MPKDFDCTISISARRKTDIRFDITVRRQAFSAYFAETMTPFC